MKRTSKFLYILIIVVLAAVFFVCGFILVKYMIDSKQSQNTYNELSEIIDAARETNDQGKRTQLYQSAMEHVLDLAIELPVYQRSVLYAYNSNVIASSSLPTEAEMNPYSSPLDRIWEIEFAQ